MVDRGLELMSTCAACEVAARYNHYYPGTQKGRHLVAKSFQGTMLCLGFATQRNMVWLALSSSCISLS
jgi:hypothetical protein